MVACMPGDVYYDFGVNTGFYRALVADTSTRATDYLEYLTFTAPQVVPSYRSSVMRPLTYAERRHCEFALLRYNLAFPAPAEARRQGQRPIGFNHCAPLARSNC